MYAARASYAAARTAYDTSLAQYKAEQEACLSEPPPPDPCVAAVREKWKPVRKGTEALRAALTALAGALGLYDALSSAGRTPDPATVQKAASAALDAAEALSRSLLDLEAP